MIEIFFAGREKKNCRPAKNIFQAGKIFFAGRQNFMLFRAKLTRYMTATYLFRQKDDFSLRNKDNDTIEKNFFAERKKL